MIGDDKKTEVICFRASKELAERLQGAADEDRRHRAVWVRHAVEDALDARDRERGEGQEGAA